MRGLRWVADDVLVEHEVEPWDELPLWIPPDTGAGTWADRDRARAGGRACAAGRSAATVADTWAWLRDGGAETMGDWRAENRPRGLSPERERALLAV
jgi:hypothetical protein